VSAVLWSAFGLDILFYAGSLVAGWHEAAMPPAAAFWAPWWDLNHSQSGIYIGIVFIAGAGLLTWHARLRQVTQAALPAGRLSFRIAGAILVALLVDMLAWEAIVAITSWSGAGEALLGERGAYAYDVTLAHIPGEFVWSVVGAPLFEEMAFRGLLLGCLLARGWNPWIAVTVVAAAFAAIHDQYYLPGLAGVFVSGLLFGWLRLLSGGLVAPMIAHALLNGWITYETWALLSGAGLATAA
jgi:membrane protease YdiL (CAAX protease family)